MAKNKKKARGLPTVVAYADPPPSVYSSLNTSSFCSVFNVSDGAILAPKPGVSNPTPEKSHNESSSAAPQDQRGNQNALERRSAPPQPQTSQSVSEPIVQNRPASTSANVDPSKRNFEPNVTNRSRIRGETSTPHASKYNDRRKSFDRYHSRYPNDDSFFPRRFSRDAAWNSTQNSSHYRSRNAGMNNPRYLSNSRSTPYSYHAHPARLRNNAANTQRDDQRNEIQPHVQHEANTQRDDQRNEIQPPVQHEANTDQRNEIQPLMQHEANTQRDDRRTEIRPPAQQFSHESRNSQCVGPHQFLEQHPCHDVNVPNTSASAIREIPSLSNELNSGVEQMSTSNYQPDDSRLMSPQINVNPNIVMTDDYIENPLLNLKLGDLLDAICNREGVTEKNVCDIFFKDLMSKLFSLVLDLSVEIQPKIYKIISYLVKVGVPCREENNDESELNFEESAFESVNYGDARLNNVAKMLKIDLKIEELMKLKKRLYLQTLAINQNDVLVHSFDINSANLENPELQSNNGIQSVMESSPAIKEELNTYAPTYLPEISVRTVCQEERERLLRLKEEMINERNLLEENEIHIIDDDMAEYQNNPIEENVFVSHVTAEQNEPSCVDVDMTEHPMINNPIQNEEGVFQGNVTAEENEPSGVSDEIDDPQPQKHPKLKRFKLPDKSTQISCITCFRKLCLLGLSDGKIKALSLQDLSPADEAASFFFLSPHKQNIISIPIWNKLVISVSADQTFTKFNWRTKTNERFDVGQPISCVEVYEGVLFIGTTTGFFGQIVLSNLVYKVKLTQLVQTSIKSLKVATNLEGEKLMVLLSDSGATLRDTSGLLLYKFYESESLENITVTFPWIGVLYGKERNELYAGTNTGNQRTPLPYSVTLIDSYNNMIVVGGYHENETRRGFIVFYSHDLLHELKSYEIRHKPTQCVVISHKKAAVLTSSRSVIILNMDLTDTETRMSALPFLSK